MTTAPHPLAHVWLHPYAPPTAGDLALLDPAERSRMAAFHHERDRHLYAVAHALLRRVLARQSRRPPTDLRFATEDHGRPYLLDDRGQPDGLRFSLSHCAAGVAVAVCQGAAVGIDVEDAARQDDPMPLAPQVATADEESELAELAPSQRRAAFLRLWTRKEALLKAKGTGLLTDPRTVSVGCHPCSAPQTLHWDNALWTLADLPCGWASAAVAVAGAGAVITHAGPALH